MRRSVFVGLVVVLAVAVAGGVYVMRKGDSRRGRPGGDRPITVTTAEVGRKDMPIYLDALGTVQAFNSVTVKSQVDGELVDIRFKEGQDVKAGDVLAVIDQRSYKAQLDQAAATRDKDIALLDSAKRELQRYLELGNRVTGQTVDTQRATVKQYEATVRADQAAVDNARVSLGYTTITAPIDGRTGIRQVDQGNIIHASDTAGLVVVNQVQPISVVFTLPQQYLVAISRRMAQASLPVLAVEADNHTVIDQGTLDLFDNQIDQTTGTIKLKAQLPNEKRELWPGGFVNVRLLLETRHDGIVIPSPAVQRGPQGTYVFLLKPDRTVEMRDVSVAATERDESLIGGGLSGGDVIVVDGAGKLQNGSHVTVQGAPGKAPTEEARGKDRPS